MSLRAWLLPDPPRGLRHRRALRIGCRTLHILSMGVYLGGVVFAVSPAALHPWFLAVLASGIALLALDLHESCAVLGEARGLATLAKLALLTAAQYWSVAAQPLLLAALVTGSVSSHMPREWRHYRPWGDARH